MTTKKLTYSEWNIVLIEIVGSNMSDQPIIGLKNEDVTQGIALRLNKITKLIFKEMETFQSQLDLHKDKDDAKERWAELWAEDCEITFEPIDASKLEDLRRKDNSLGQKYDYSNLIEQISL